MESSQRSLAGESILRSSSLGDVLRGDQVGAALASSAGGLPGLQEQVAARLGRSSDGLAHRYATSLTDIFAHSWHSIPSSSWRWIPRRASVGELGFSARSSEVRHFGSQARVVRQIRDSPPLRRSFVEVVRGEGMDRGRGRFPRCMGGVGRGRSLG